jgi:hypothetical protein
MSSTSTTAPAASPPQPKKPFYRSFGFQITVALIAGILLGILALNLGPDAAGNPNGLAATLSTIGSSYVTLLKAPSSRSSSSRSSPASRSCGTSPTPRAWRVRPCCGSGSRLSSR